MSSIKSFIRDTVKPLKFLSENYFLLFAVTYIIQVGFLVFTVSGTSAMIIGILFLSLIYLLSRRIRVLIIALSALLLGSIVVTRSEQRSYINEENFKDVFASSEGFNVTVDADPKLNHYYTDYPVRTVLDGRISRFILRTERFPRRVIGDNCFVNPHSVEIKELSDQYSLYLRRNGYAGLIEVRGSECSSTQDVSLIMRYKRLIYKLKARSTKIINDLFLEPKASLLLGMIYGDDRLFSESFEEDLRTTGTTHIIAASGFNVTILFLIVEKFFGNIIPLKMRVSLTIFLIITFSFSAGLSGSILRASTTMFFILFSKIIGRVLSTVEALIMSVFIILLISPQKAADIGLLLSSAAMIGLIIILPVFSDLINRVLGSFQKAISFFEENFFGTLSCTMGTLPISNIFFGTGSLISVIPNLFLLPLVELIYYLGVSIIFFSYLRIHIAVDLLTLPLNILLELFVIIITFSANQIGRFDWLSDNRNIYLLISAVMLMMGYVYLIKNSRFSNFSSYDV